MQKQKVKNKPCQNVTQCSLRVKSTGFLKTYLLVMTNILKSRPFFPITFFNVSSIWFLDIFIFFIWIEFVWVILRPLKKVLSIYTLCTVYCMMMIACELFFLDFMLFCYQIGKKIATCVVCFILMLKIK
jgi:hypothetical protein